MQHMSSKVSSDVVIEISMPGKEEHSVFRQHIGEWDQASLHTVLDLLSRRPWQRLDYDSA
jgi:hypothetical protein